MHHESEAAGPTDSRGQGLGGGLYNFTSKAGRWIGRNLFSGPVGGWAEGMPRHARRDAPGNLHRIVGRGIAGTKMAS